MHEPAPQGDVEPGGHPAVLAVGLSGCVALLAVMCAGVFGAAALVLVRDDPPPAAAPEPVVASVLPAPEPLEAEDPEDEDEAEDEVPDEAAAVATTWRPAPVREAPEPEPEETWDLVEPMLEPTNPTPEARHPKPGMGAVQFEIAAGDAIHVYASGDLVAAMSPNRREAFVDLAPATHRVIFKDVVSGRTLHKGTLTITEGRVVRVAFGKLQAPEQIYGPADAWRGK